jgi:integrase
MLSRVAIRPRRSRAARSDHPAASPRTARASRQYVTLVSAIFAFAIERGLYADNPVRGVKKATVRKVERFLSEAEIAELAQALDAEAHRSSNPYPSAAIKLLLTGC